MTGDFAHTGGRRDRCVLTGKPTLEPVFAFPAFPVFMGCVDTPAEDDLFLDLSFSICTETGLVQLDVLPPPDQLYQSAHNDAIGETWRAHRAQFAAFAAPYLSGRVVEIGGGNGAVAQALSAAPEISDWLIVDPAPTVAPGAKIRVVRDVFSDRLGLAPGSADAAVHTHLLEHVFDPPDFMAQLARLLRPGGVQVFSVPNLHRMLARGYANCINFEHTVCLTEDHIDALVARHGFELLAKTMFRDDHSIFYAVRNGGASACPPWPNRYAADLPLVREFRDGLIGKVARLSREIAGFDGPVFVFGAHIFAQYLFAAGLPQARIAGILDNSPLKRGRRLYGTRFTVQPPEVLADHPGAGVVLNVAQYREEIVAQLRALAPDVEIFE